MYCFALYEKLIKYVYLFQQEDICHETNKTFEIVDSCPENDVVLQKRLEKKKCSSASPCHGEPLVYHCLRFETKLGEVCSPVRLIKGIYIYTY